MSESNLELMRRSNAAYNARDIQAFIGYCDPSIEFHSMFAAVGGGVYHGHDGLRKWFPDLEEAWGNETRLEPEAYFDLGEQTLAFAVLRGRGRHSGAEVAMRSPRLRSGAMVSSSTTRDTPAERTRCAT
jgi:ketosteroid isomerase-like protein